jgi:2-polyprenyl-6-methoxyphenol hydroxylase-like FAD-dependent oxidoreductase
VKTDIAIVGSGLAGSVAAAVLGRTGHDVIAVDPHDVFPPEFRCEKLEQDHLQALQLTGLAEAVMQAGTYIDTLWIARFGRLIDKMPLEQYAMPYDRLVNTLRAQIPPSVKVCRAWANAIEPSADRQHIRLSDGRYIDARLAILASGLNWTLREALGVKRELVSPCHSIAIGFDLQRVDGSDFTFPALQYNPEQVGKGVAYLTLFRIGVAMRANLFLYQPLKSACIAAFRTDPDAALRALFPGLSRLTGTTVIRGPIKIRPTDLHIMRNIEQPGVVMVGDAFAAACPATGTGTMKVFNDVHRLCNQYIPLWLDTPGMGLEKIQSYYADPIKIDCDTSSVAKAYNLRSMSIDAGLRWHVQRWLRFASRLLKWTLRSTFRRQPPNRAIATGPRRM